MKTHVKRYLEKHGFERFEPKAVLFDMDGVLYDSMPHHAVAWQQSMATFGITMTEKDAYLTEGARGIDTIREMVRRQTGRDIGEAEAQTMYDEKSRLFHLMDEAPLMPGILELMETVSRQGLNIGIVTGSGQRPLIARVLSDFKDYVDEQHIVTAYDVSRGKPSPDPYLKGMEEAGSKPWETVVVENAPLGIRAGVAARAFTIAVNTGLLDDGQLSCEGCDLLFHSISELGNGWPDIFADGQTEPKGTQARHWDQKLQQLDDYIKTHHQLPSKHRLADHRLLNWIKYNRKLIATGKMQPDRQERFLQLLNEAARFHKVNQYSYATGEPVPNHPRRRGRH